MNLFEQIAYESSAQHHALEHQTHMFLWDNSPFCKSAEYLFYHALLTQKYPDTFMEHDPTNQTKTCFQKSRDHFGLFGQQTYIILEGSYAGLLAKKRRDGSIIFGRYLFDTCLQLPYSHLEELWLTTLPPHAYINHFIALLSKKEVPHDAKVLRENSKKYSAWIRRKTKKELL